MARALPVEMEGAAAADVVPNICTMIIGAETRAIEARADNSMAAAEVTGTAWGR
jgi:hypothetical protein